MMILPMTMIRSVLEALAKLNDDRKCYRLVGGVLVERTKAQVVPAVQDNVQSVCWWLLLTADRYEKLLFFL